MGNTSKNADTILKQVKVAENRNMNNEATIEGLDKNLKEANKMKRDSEYKLEELTRRLGVLEVVRSELGIYVEVYPESSSYVLLLLHVL